MEHADPAGNCATLPPVKRFAIALLALTLCAAPPLSAQRTAQRRVFVAATDGSGTPVLDLTAGDVQILENGIPREVARASRTTGPMRIALVVDSSNGMSPLLNNLRAGLTTFLDQLPGEHEIALISTGGQIRIRQPVTTDRQKLKAAVAVFSSDNGGNSVVETMMEVDRRFLNAAPGQWPVLVIVTTDIGATAWEPNHDRFNRFVRGFVERGGTAHAIVMLGKPGGVITEYVMNVVENTSGYYESMAIANVLPDKMKMLAEHLDAQYKALSNWYELEFAGDARAQSPRIQVATTRDGLSVRTSLRRPF